MNPGGGDGGGASENRPSSLKVYSRKRRKPPPELPKPDEIEPRDIQKIKNPDGGDASGSGHSLDKVYSRKEREPPPEASSSPADKEISSDSILNNYLEDPGTEKGRYAGLFSVPSLRPIPPEYFPPPSSYLMNVNEYVDVDTIVDNDPQKMMPYEDIPYLGPSPNDLVNITAGYDPYGPIVVDYDPLPVTYDDKSDDDIGPIVREPGLRSIDASGRNTGNAGNMNMIPYYEIIQPQDPVYLTSHSTYIVTPTPYPEIRCLCNKYTSSWPLVCENCRNKSGGKFFMSSTRNF